MFGQRTTDGISHKLPHKYHSLHIYIRFCFSGKVYFLPLFVKLLGPWINCAFCGNHEVYVSVCFSVLLKVTCLKFVGFSPIVVGLL